MSHPGMSLDVVGADHPNRKGPGRRFEITMCNPGEPVELRPEPGNAADPRAVAVFSARNIQLGYVRAERAPWISAMIRAGRPVKAIFQQPAKWGAVIRISIDGNDPDLPPQVDTAPNGEPDFWPDYLPPDDDV